MVSKAKTRLLKSGLPKGSTVGYVKGKSCGRKRHDFVVARTETYAICVRCHLRLVLGPEEEAREDAVDNSL